MIKEALEYILDLKQPHFWTAESGDVYADKRMSRVEQSYYPDALEVTNLTSLLAFIHSNDLMMQKLIVQIKSPNEVRLYSTLDDDMKRDLYIIAKCPTAAFNFGVWQDSERFNIGVQANFVENEDKTLLLKFAGTTESGTISTYDDDGVTQKATIRTGVASKGTALVPNPVKLRPYRTFAEVEQPESGFVFRMRQGSGVECALFEADGGTWKNEAMHNIQTFIENGLDTERLTELGRTVTILS